MKRIVCLLLTASMLLSAGLLVACTSGDPTATVTSAVTAEPTATSGAPVTLSDEEYIEKMRSFFSDMSHVGEPSVMEHNYPAPEIYPTKGEHPRLLFNAADIPTIKANFTAEENAIEYANYLRLKEDTATVDAILNGEDTDVSDRLIEAKAFAYAIEGDLKCGYEAILLAKKALLNVPVIDIVAAEDMDYNDSNTRGKGDVLFAMAEVYDWCYDLLTDEEKAQLYAGCQNVLGPYMEIGYPPHAEWQSSITSHSSEAQLLRNWLGLAVAVYDEYPNAYEFIGGKFFDEYVPFRNYYYESDFYHQGSSYGLYRHTFDLYSAWIMKAMSGQMVYIDNMKNVVKSYAYSVLPNYSFVRMGDDGNGHRFYYLGRCAAMVAGLFKDPVAKQLELDYLYATEESLTGGGGELSPVEVLIINDPTVVPTPIEDLPLAVYNGSPVGQMIARTGWDRDGYKVSTSDDIVVFMKIGETHAGNHDHLDSGSFQIYYKGALAIDSSTDNEADGREVEYRYRTIAHNSLLIYGKQTKDPMDWGGQRYLDECPSIHKWGLKERRFGRVGAHEFLETDRKLNYAYISGEITQAYPTTAVKEVYRSMLFVPTDDETVPGLFFVFDKITSKKAEYEKVFLLHMREEPTVEGNVTTITRVADGYNGKLVNQTLLPENPEYRKIGGDGQTAVIGEINVAPESVVDPTERTDDGWGRVEVSTVGNETDYFFNVMTIGAADTMTDIPVAVLTETDDHAAAKIMNYVAVFSKNSERDTEGFTFTVDGDGELTYCVAGVAAGEWEITVGMAKDAAPAPTVITVTATEDGGFLYFTAPAGLVTIAPKA